MSEKVTIQDIIELLAEKHSMTKKDAEIFVKGMFIPKQENITESSQGNHPADVPGQPLPEHQHKGNGRDDQQRQIQNQCRSQFHCVASLPLLIRVL